jgi:hypothetical protein
MRGSGWNLAGSARAFSRLDPEVSDAMDHAVLVLRQAAMWLSK